MTKRDITVHIFSSRQELARSLFETEEDEGFDESNPFDDPMTELPEPTEFIMQGRLLTSPTRVEIVYEEGELSGMPGVITAIGFNRTNPTLVSMLRTGPVRTAMTFEPGKRHYCVYNTPFSDFEVCVKALNVQNDLLTAGTVQLDYIIEIHGAKAERCVMDISVK